MTRSPGLIPGPPKPTLVTGMSRVFWVHWQPTPYIIEPPESLPARAALLVTVSGRSGQAFGLPRFSGAIAGLVSSVLGRRRPCLDWPETVQALPRVSGRPRKPASTVAAGRLGHALVSGRRPESAFARVGPDLASALGRPVSI